MFSLLIFKQGNSHVIKHCYALISKLPILSVGYFLHDQGLHNKASSMRKNIILLQLIFCYLCQALPAWDHCNFFSQNNQEVVWLLLCKFASHLLQPELQASIQLESHRLYQNHSMTLYYGGLIEHGVIFLKYKNSTMGLWEEDIT